MSIYTYMYMPASAARPHIILCFEQVHGVRATTKTPSLNA